MAGSINSPSVIWVAGETTGKNQVGATIVVSGYLPLGTSDILDSANNYADAAVDVLHDRLVASGILES